MVQKHKKSKDYCKADLKQRILFFITTFRLAIPAFFRFTITVLHLELNISSLAQSSSLSKPQELFNNYSSSPNGL